MSVCLSVDVPDSGLSPGAVVGICVGVVLLLLLLAASVTAAVIFWKRRSKGEYYLNDGKSDLYL